MRALLRLFVVAVVLSPLTARAIDVWGDQWGTWTRDNSPYNVVGNISVPAGSTLVIEPGVVVDFQGHYKFIVDNSATLLAVGTESDSIYFTTDYPYTGWHGIRFLSASSNSQMTYCHLQYGRATGYGEDGRGGAIYCSSSSPTISSSTITENYAEERGGGIYCYNSDADITGNTVSSNSVSREELGYRGAGIYCEESDPLITDNTIEGNHTSYNGGGICFWYCGDASTIANNLIRNNSTVYGGGICCKVSSPTIEGNTISDNFAVHAGGGIDLFDRSSPIVRENAITGNRTGAYGGGGIICATAACPLVENNFISGNTSPENGGGVFCQSGSSAIITNNTIVGNRAGWGGGVYCDNSSPRIANTILWGDTAVNGPEIFVRSGNPIVTYCDVHGGWPGIGNIDADPIFIGPEREDFYIRWHSPCIDAGDPNFPLDPDGTRSDMGAFYFNQDVPGIVELYPHDTPIVIPRQGGELSFDGWVFNFSGRAGRVDIWTYLFAPEIGRYGPLDVYNVRVPTDSLGLNQISRHVPEVAPEGDYVFVAYIGQYPSTIVDSSYFYFTKEGEIVGVTGDWTEDNLPLDYALFQNYPNPFNAATVISYQLPINNCVRLEIYNLFGQKVATLVDSKQQTGYRSVLWDASDVSSGLYFYRLSAGDYTETRRMILVK